ncbi:MAG TPA: Fic family protein [Gemmataceae bacterium]|jgi:hypothetical protein|nr:Fic family protein [Gemmataceae bacterium]
MRFDYQSHDWTIVARIMNENSLRMSRTRHGKSDTGTSEKKRPLRLSGEALQRRCAQNEERVQQFLFANRNGPKPRNAEQVLELLWTLADMTNDGLLTAGKLRDWPISAQQLSPDGQPVAGPEAKVPPNELPAALADFSAAVFRRWEELPADPVPLAAWAEWELNGGKLHPFYDGCGRIARSFAALLLLRGSWLLPLYDSPAEYFAHGNRGTDAFISYMRARIAECAGWLRDEA